MYQEEFLPVVFKVELRSEQCLSVEKWQKLINTILRSYVDDISKNEECLIGHIKALAEIDKANFIKYSCINDLNHINSEVHCKQNNINKINMIINSLVSNISENESCQFLEKSCLLAEKAGDQINIEIVKNEKITIKKTHHHKENEVCPICGEHHLHKD
ncbi:hypothetical protein GH810_05450 [Acetobacterium paludosum]|uniref:Uncharacterized protein n=1 Tax=Acetobacterium paludosum TaxID=52693 RepID=A0A923KVS1_9FIRM|nr:hypothetical protein [Acetobacterium paludosum]MBC3887750.1 hypothetical protein [Acetobacterium paludosum]